tara:strand:+ start:339 stop:908 length:570 start_codon:yes stop_codon:yes gene_type:complete
MCLTKPSYDIYEHWFYINKVNEKWIEQLQELLFDRKELFEEEQDYLYLMDTLKKRYDLLATKAMMKEYGWDKKGYIQFLKTNTSQFMDEGLEEIKKLNDELKRIKYDIYLKTTTGEEALKWINEWKKDFPEDAKEICDDDDDDVIDVSEKYIDGKIYLVGNDGEFKDIVFDSKDYERIGKLVDGKIILD